MSYTENSAYLHAVRIQLEGGDTQGAMQGMLDLIHDLCDQVRDLEMQVQSLTDHLDPNETFDLFDPECFIGCEESEYIVECSGCGCMLEIEGELLEEDAELSCPECGAILSLF